MEELEVLKTRVDNLDEKVDMLGKRFDKVDKKQDDLGDGMNKLSLTMKELEITLKNSIEVNKELKEEMSIQKQKANEKDSKIVDNIKSVIIGALGTGIIGWILVQIGFKK